MYVNGCMFLEWVGVGVFMGTWYRVSFYTIFYYVDEK